MEHKLRLKPLSELLNYRFFIPSFQRGYRWTDLEVKDLLDDVSKFIDENHDSPKEVFYCLQPIIVYEKDGQYVLIDGQQRLTTIYLILTYLNDVLTILGKKKYSLSYQTRPGSEMFLDKIDLKKSHDNVDYHFIAQAYRTIDTWFKSKEGSNKVDIVNALTSEKKNVKVIWYEIDPKEAIDVFTRINIGKIPLTNAELIKALFLQQNNFSDAIALKQIQIATEWDTIEKRLQDNSFWYFITPGQTGVTYENRIEYIFDLIHVKKKEHEELYTFHRFASEFEQEIANKGRLNIDRQWLKVKKYFSILEEWYSHQESYHYIGFLIEYGYSISKLIDYYKTMDKDDFIDFIKEKIKEQFTKINVEALSFDNSSDKKDIRKVLLMFNIETLLSTQKATVRFPFDRYKNEKWDIEHVNAQTIIDIDKQSYKIWAGDLLDYFTGSRDSSKASMAMHMLNSEHFDYCTRLIKIINAERYDEEAVSSLADDLHKAFKEGNIEEGDGIANLALLDEGTNRSYKNAMFPIKRKRIIDNDKKGIFVPICTKNMFLKYYSGHLGEIMFWQQQDANDYLNELKQVLRNYLQKNN